MLKNLLIIAGIVLVMWIPLLRCFVFNIHRVVGYTFKDIYTYIRHKRWNDFRLFGIDMFIGMFGKGKTLTMTHRVIQLHAKYGDKIRIVSNYQLKGIPYIPLYNFEQLVELGTDDSDYIGTVVCIDEISSILSNRNYASFPLELLGLLCQPRKKSVYIMCTAQRFFMVDKLFRALTTYVYDCRKLWRFQRYRVYDAWELENSTSVTLIKPLKSDCWFVRDVDFSCYDTSELIDKNKASDFISNEEAIVRKGMDSAKVVNTSGMKISKRTRKKYGLAEK